MTSQIKYKHNIIPFTIWPEYRHIFAKEKSTPNEIVLFGRHCYNNIGRTFSMILKRCSERLHVR